MKLIIRAIRKIMSILFSRNEDRDFFKLNFGQIKLIEMKKKYKENLPINSYEFQSFSQFGEDGIIQYLINNIDIKKNFFFEFGVENYKEANTRFLLENNNWSGAIIDSNENFINLIKSYDCYWKYDLKVKKSFITAENINQLIIELEIPKELGLLSIDIDGNDYWVWKAINSIEPSIVIIEYNARFGPKESVTIPYKENFSRKGSQYPNIYFGCSLSALYKLGKSKGYSLVATNLNGNNAFFIKTELLKNLKEFNPEECFNKNTFSELIDKNNKIIKLNSNEEKKILNKFPLENV